MTSFEGIYRKIESERQSWLEEATTIVPIPFFSGKTPRQRKDWWGCSAKTCASTGLNDWIDQTVPSNPGFALDLCCGNSTSGIHLLQKRWRVLCVDYAQEALSATCDRARTIDKQWLKINQLQTSCCSIETFKFPTDVDLVLASSALPYCNPLHIKTIMQNIYRSLKVNGLFVGNFFALEYVRNPGEIYVTRQMGAWFIPNKESVVQLLKGHGYEVVRCEAAGQQDPLSALFAAKKIQID